MAATPNPSSAQGASRCRTVEPTPATAQELAQINDAARVLTLHLTALAARGPELEASLAAIVPANIDGFVVCDDPLLITIMLG